ncbi:MAG: T9SS type A sorting domain-containing protein [Saprospiraceae bacterium]|nr:T9SS type A sorting domain-containing protein [Saprospiraceae bacterium]
MKRLLYVTMISLVFTPWGFSQSNDVVLKIDHTLSGMEVDANTVAANNMGHEFYLTRLEYYISDILISYDGGQELKVDEVWALVDAFEGEVEIELGELDLNNVEGITFSLGVDPAHNHLDPTIWPSGHPLAPQFPSMHWGWAAGYRFIALEGYSGTDLNQRVEIHGLGDSNYGSVTIRKAGVERNGKTYIDLEADFTKALKSISINGGLIVHGEGAQAKTCLDNCRVDVFSPSLNTSTDFEEIQNIKVYPNPSSGVLNVDYRDVLGEKPDEIMITDVMGRNIQRVQTSGSKQEVLIQNPGSYLITILSNGQIIKCEMVLIE